MGILQQGFNQALTGTTFLLQQTPGWKVAAERTQNKQEARNIAKERSKIEDSILGHENAMEDYVHAEREGTPAPGTLLDYNQLRSGKEALEGRLEALKEQQIDILTKPGNIDEFIEVSKSNKFVDDILAAQRVQRAERDRKGINPTEKATQTVATQQQQYTEQKNRFQQLREAIDDMNKSGMMSNTIAKHYRYEVGKAEKGGNK